ncbi:MAG: ABC transporter ATP-binding protein, partial [Rhodoferax sp.]|nr:ABC transporter ATP-binding protein [Rhodoferax sp.]
LLHDLQQRLGLSYLFIAHDLAMVRNVAHRVAVMFSGQVVELGDTAQVFGQPGHPYTQALLDAVPIPDPARQRAKLAASPPDVEFRRGAAAAGPCCFGEDHARTGTPHWHWLGDGHGVSCRFRPESG